MARQLADWLEAFIGYTDHMEAPKLMRTWAGISTIASCLRKKVWIDQDQFVWNPGLYIVFVGPPGVVTKSTTTDMGSNLLRQVPGIKFGPNSITWQALATAFAGACEMFEWPVGSGDWHDMSAITLVSRELGSLLNPKDGDLVNIFIELYDGSKIYEKVTKMSGNDTIASPWINMEGATTPSWIAENVPKSALGGGLISRIIFVYGDEKEKMVPYPAELLRDPKVKAAHVAIQQALIHDLEWISMNLVGPYELTREAITWGETWYRTLWTGAKEHYSDDKLMGYIARKQTHLHKVAMVMAASHKDELTITLEDLQLAESMLTSVEGCLDKVFSQIGRTEQSVQAEKFIALVKQKGKLYYDEAYRTVHTHFPDFRDFEGVLTGAIRSGQVEIWPEQGSGRMMITAAGGNGRPLSDHNERPHTATVIPLPGVGTETKTSNS